MKKVMSLILVTVMFVSVLFSLPAHALTINLDGLTAIQIVNKYPEASKTIRKALRKLETTIDIKEYDISQRVAIELYKSVMVETPELFYVNPYSLKCAISKSTGMVVSLEPVYCFDKEEIPDRINEFNAVAQQYLKGVDEDWPDYKKCRYIHDMIANNCEYDVNFNDGEINNSSDYGVLIENVAVCQGYALAYNYLLGELGIKSYFVESTTINHAWSLVKLNKKYYHVDVTWDDPTPDLPGRILHSYFLISDKRLSELEPVRKWNLNGMDARDTSYDDAWWSNIRTFIYTVKGKDYYINQNYTDEEYGAFMCYNENLDKHTCLYKITSRWYENESKKNYWRGCHSNLVYDGKLFYFNTPSNIFSIKSDGSNKTKYYSNPSNDCDIYGLSLQSDGSIYAEIQSTPISNDGTVVIVAGHDKQYKIGDMNLDGKININDVTMIQRTLAKEYVPKLKENAYADYDGNGKLNVRDATAIQKMLVS